MEQETTNSDSTGVMNRVSNKIALGVSLVVAIVYYFSNPNGQAHFDYTFRVAGNMLGGAIAFTEKQPSWLNEFVPFDGYYYSVFPLGSVLTMMPAALLKTVGLITEMPGLWIAAIQAGIVCFFLLKIASKYNVSRTRQILMSLGIVLGTFMWTNLTFGGAWQLALGFAMVGELGAIYFTVYDRRPWLAGFFFAVAFGNRTENLLTAPVLLYLMARGETVVDVESDADEAVEIREQSWRPEISSAKLIQLAKFCVVPFVLGVATLIYNYVRFHSFTDFGYARIPGVLNEPWYDHGIFSTHYLWRQAEEMLWKWWEYKDKFPYLFPNPFSSSIIESSPFLLLVAWPGARDRWLKYASWVAVIILTFLLWIHGNSGGWQFGYRYAMVLLPWAFVIILESARKRPSVLEWTLYGIAFAANIYATWIFNWTKYLSV